jgi:hypothetical protein
MLKRKITINKKAKKWEDKFPMVSVTWSDIVSDSGWQSIDNLKKSSLATCVTKGTFTFAIKRYNKNFWRLFC